MSSSTITSKIFRVSYSVTSYHLVEVERPSDITEEALISSITKDELINGESNGEYDALKDAWRSKNVTLILDEEGEEVVFS